MALESRDIYQKLRQSKCLLFKIWMIKFIKFTVMLKKPFGTWQFGRIGVLVNFIIQKLKSKHLVCLGFWYISRDSRAKIYLSLEKMWAYIIVCDNTVWEIYVCVLVFYEWWKSGSKAQLLSTKMQLNLMTKSTA